jgi:hypothetical protein
LSPARKSFFGAVSVFATGRLRPVSMANLAATGLESAGACSSVAGGTAGVGVSLGVCLGMSFGTAGSSGAGVSPEGLGSSFLSNRGFDTAADAGLGDCSLRVSILLGTLDSSFLGDSGRRRLTGLSCMSLIGDVRPELDNSAKGLPLPKSTLLRCCLMRLISAIHAGWAGGACFGLGDSGLLSALSNQLDFVGLHRFEGLGGDVSSCDASFSLKVALKVDATDLALL